jgi:hypothetical protein
MATVAISLNGTLGADSRSSNRACVAATKGGGALSTEGLGATDIGDAEIGWGAILIDDGAPTFDGGGTG